MRIRITTKYLNFRASLLALSLIVGQTQTANAQTSTPIKHLVVIFQENVSFDHYFATYPNAANPGFHARKDTPSINGLTGALLTNNPNSAQPFRLDRTQQFICDQNHDYKPEQQAYNAGLLDKFVQFAGRGAAERGLPCDLGRGKEVVMGYYDGNTVTALWNYAQHFAISDNFYQTTFGPSAPGAISLVSGQTHGASFTAIRNAGATGGQIVE